MLQVNCRMLLWEEDWKGVPSPDIIISSDVIYDPDAFPALVAVLKHLLLRRPPSVSASAPASATPSAKAAGGISEESVVEAAELPALAPQPSPVAYLSAQIRSPTSLQSFKALLTAKGLEWSLIDLQASNCNVQFDHLSLREDIDQVFLMRIVDARTLW